MKDSGRIHPFAVGEGKGGPSLARGQVVGICNLGADDLGFELLPGFLGEADANVAIGDVDQSISAPAAIVVLVPGVSGMAPVGGAGGVAMRSSSFWLGVMGTWVSVSNRGLERASLSEEPEMFSDPGSSGAGLSDGAVCAGMRL